MLQVTTIKKYKKKYTIQLYIQIINFVLVQFKAVQVKTVLNESVCNVCGVKAIHVD